MGKWPNPLWSQEKTYMQLVSDNREVTEAYNRKMLSALTVMGGLLMMLPLLAAPFSNTKMGAVPAYSLGILIYFALFLLFKLPVMEKYTLFGLYFCFSLFFQFAIYLSVIHAPGTRATILLGAFSLMPLSFIDRPGRMDLFAAFWLVVHTVLALHLKPKYALDDTINCLCLGILGCFLGNRMVQVRLESYEAHRLLTIEKETDVLTGLFNRRKLFETLAALETVGAEKPTGILMVDIDHFKEFNDSYGHVAGDRCLGHFGGVLTEFARDYRMQFYRYGGEEFVAMAYGYDEKELFAIAENLRIAVQSTAMDGYPITISIGAAYCGDEHVRNYEKAIDRADKAAYAAKRAGRNSVRMEQDEVQSS